LSFSFFKIIASLTKAVSERNTLFHSGYNSSFQQNSEKQNQENFSSIYHCEITSKHKF